MRILVTGSLGYVGSALLPQLNRTWPAAQVVGLDTGWFASGLVLEGRAPETYLTAQRYVDIRDVTKDDVDGVDYVIHLAAISNDPMGDRFAALTSEVNFQQSVHLATMARDAGARGFVFAS